MIKANELRIGNWILIEIHPAPPQWHRVQARDIFDILEGRITLNSLSGIHLSPEILEKFGFAYRNGGISGADMWQGMGWWNIKQCEWVSFRGDFRRTKPVELILTGYFNVRIQYLHHLQNLVFDMTGEELNYQP